VEAYKEQVVSNPGDRWRRSRIVFAAALFLIPALLLGRCVADRQDRVARVASDAKAARLPVLTVSGEGGIVVLTGNVASEAVGQSLTAEAQQAFTGDQVLPQFSVVENAATIADPSLLFAVMHSLQDPWSLLPVDGAYELRGFLASETDRVPVVTATQMALGPDIKLVDKLEVVANPEEVIPAAVQPTQAPETTVAALPSTTIAAVVNTTIAAEPAVEETAAVEAVALINETIALQGITFRTGSFELTAEGRAVVDEIAVTLAANPTVNVAISGHTDNVGDPALNTSLSQQRADAVLLALVSKGIDVGRMTSEGFGDTKPIADNATSAGRAENRRIEFAVAPN
jgi:outer membrane protein OmpA-like peptidoglycan-associated protein